MAWRDCGKRRRGHQDAETSLLSCTILTTGANHLTRDVHDRMPVILPESDWDTWLDSTCDDSQQLSQMLVPYDSADMQLDPVSTYVNNARHEGPECVAIGRDLF